MTGPSNAEIVRQAISDARDAQKDLSNYETRTAFVKELAAQHPELNAESLKAQVSKELRQGALARGESPSDFGGRASQKYDSKLQTTEKPNPVSVGPKTGAPISGPTIKHPELNPLAAPEVPQELSVDGAGATINGLFEMLRIIDKNIPALSPTEKTDLGHLWRDFLSQHSADSRSFFLMMLSGTLGICMGKIIDGRRATAAENRAKADAKKKQKAQEPPVVEKPPGPEPPSVQYPYPGDN